MEACFKRDDMRGIWPNELNAEVARLTGHAMAELLANKADGKPEIVLGHDARLGSFDLLTAFARGVEEAGGRCTSIGLASTEQVYYACGRYADRFAGGAMVTASHNPLMWFRSMYRILHHQERTYKWAGLGAGVALIGVTLHECVEFNLLAWSNALVFTALLSVVAVCGSSRHRHLKRDKTEEEKAKESATRREKRRQNRHDRWRWRLALVPLSLAVLVIGAPFVYFRSL